VGRKFIFVHKDEFPEDLFNLMKKVDRDTRDKLLEILVQEGIAEKVAIPEKRDVTEFEIN